MRAVALLDSNVVIAAVAQSHEHNAPSLALLNDRPEGSFAVAAHSYAEAYAVLTNAAERAPFRWSAPEAWAALEAVAAVTRLVGLTPGQMFGAVRAFASTGGVGPGLYDRLIGEAAVQNGMSCILTWNVKHMKPLFPDLVVQDPPAYG